MGMNSSLGFAVLVLAVLLLPAAYPAAAAEAGRPDLAVAGISVPSSADEGGRVTIPVILENRGPEYSSFSYTFLYASRDTVLDAPDTYLGRAYSGSLGPGASRTVTLVVTVPEGTAGSLFFIAKADGTGRISEGDEQNNLRASGTVPIGPASPPSSPTTRPTTVPTTTPVPGPSGDQGPDLVIAGIAAPSSAVPGGKASVSVTVRNEGTAPASYSYVYYYLSADPTRDGGDPYLGRAYLASLPTGASRTATSSLTIPSGVSGRVYLLALADGSGRIRERDEGNNVGSSQPVALQTAEVPTPTPTPTPTRAIILKPDLVAVSADGPSSGTPGSPLAVKVSVRNGGTTSSGTAQAAWYLSPDQAIGPGDTYLGSLTIPPIADHSAAIVSGSLTLPPTVPAGTYTLGTILDPADMIKESDEGNNIACASIPVRVTVTAPGGSVEAAVEAAIVKYTNQERVKAGLGPLGERALLTSVARAHSLDMKERDFFSHTNPDGLSPFDRMEAAGYRYSAAGENIAATSSFTLASDPDEVGRYFVQELWMKSTGHRENLLGASYTEIGVGIVYEPDRSSSPYGFIATQNFGRPR